ncbi:MULTISPECIES: hypothetical protein [Pseudomonas]|uniref:hypothetical protein n=1 Tax=Pseudomonas TaxID=286 RepID=UPI0013CE7411|nr:MULTISPECIES: hypothetical protein [Pseudomonas]MBD8615385.1 hypothetical protein [Pseudomonas putida]MBD8681961.1 hypothetical protein [Pseudomonas sp. CFBP 13719]
MDAEPAQAAQKASAGINVGDVIAKVSHSPLPTAAFPSATDPNQEKLKLRDVDPEP